MGLLEGLKILDFSGLLPGPFATLLLADLGADVLHVQRPTDEEQKIMDRYLLRSKKQITANLKDPKAVEQIKNLVHEYDIVLEQFRPGVMDRLGLGYKDLKKINPQIIYCSLTGYGQTGPYKDRPGHDNNYLAISGVAGISGTKESGPAQNGVQIADLAGGSMHTAVAILSAYIYRERTNEGQALDISMTDCAMSLTALTAPVYLVEEKEPQEESLLLNGGTFYGYYETKDGRWFSVGSLEPKFRKLLCEAIGRPDLIEVSLSDDPKNIRIFKEVIKDAFLSKTFSEWSAIFADNECCVEPVLTYREAMQHPQTIARGMLVNVPGKNGEVEKQLACPIKSNIWEPKYKHIGLLAGENNDEFFKK